VDALRELQATDTDPGGEVCPDDLTRARVARTLSQGFYYRWDWPNDNPDHEWLEARSAWNRHVRAELERSREGYDSPLLVWREIQRQIEAGRRQAIHRAWTRWEHQRAKLPPPTVAVWIDRFLVDYAVQWAKDNDPAIIWYESRAVEAALSGLLPTYGAGAITIPNPPHTCAMSVRAHGIGKNLQAWSNQLVLCPPASGQTWEQLLGRTHRQGQMADEVHATVCTHTRALRRAFGQAVEDARFQRDTTGNNQKLLVADKDEI